uniref:PHD-type domain-containing protein n=1 Tax=Physcomitrium patens TaxID=3218 RepID=A0A7I4DNG1_PHYPA
MVPTGVVEREDQPEPAAAPPVPVITPKTLRSHSIRTQTTPGDGDAGADHAPGAVAAAAASAGGGGAADVMQGNDAGQERRGRRRGRRKKSDVPLDNPTRILKHVKYLLIKMRVHQNLLDAYTGEGWKGQSREKIRPEQELQRAKAQILRSKLAIREAIHELDDVGLEGSLDKNAFDSEGRIYHEEIFCAKCKSQEALPDNDIILCDGACNRGFHQYCLDPPLATEDIPPGDEGWLCPVCDCKMECIEAINSYFGTSFEVENSWESFFSNEAGIAAGGGTQEGAGGDWPSSGDEDDEYDPETAEGPSSASESGAQVIGLAVDWPSSDDEDHDYDPEAAEEPPGASGSGTQTVGLDVDWPSTDDEDDDFDPEGIRKQANSDEESSSDESEEDGEDSGSVSGFRENEASSGVSDKDEQEPSEKHNLELTAVTNIKKLARKGKRNIISNKGKSEYLESSDSDDSDVSLFDEFKGGNANLGLRRGDPQAAVSAADEEAVIIAGKRHRKAVDYKRLHDEMYGKAEADNDDDVISEDEDWGPERRRRRTIPDDPNSPRSRIRGRKVRTPSGDISKGADADLPSGLPDMPSHFPTGSQGEVGSPQDIPALDGAADSPGGEKRMWRRLPDSAVEAALKISEGRISN